MNNWDAIFKDNKIFAEKEKHSPWLYLISETMKFNNFTKIIEIGCGIGTSALFFIKEGFKVTILDKSKVAIDIARVNIGDKKIDVIISDAQNIPICNSSIEIVLCEHTIQFLQKSERERALKEFYRILKLKGLVYCSLFSTKDPSFLFGITEEENTIVYDKRMGIWAGLVVHFFTEKEITILFKDFEIISLKHKFPNCTHDGISHHHGIWEIIAKKTT